MSPFLWSKVVRGAASFPGIGSSRVWVSGETTPHGAGASYVEDYYNQSSAPRGVRWFGSAPRYWF